jgi:hypothetical protein
LVERTVSLEVEKAYSELKAHLLEKNCKITAEEAPTFISVKQGSLWGISPSNRQENDDLPPCSCRFLNANNLFFLSGLGLEKPNRNRHCPRRSCGGSVLVDIHRLGFVCDHAAVELLELAGYG